MLLEWFETKEIVAFAEEIAQELEKLRGVGVTSIKATGDKNDQKDQKKLDALIVRVHAFSKKQQLNVYKKAKFLNTIKWQLKDSGEDAVFIDEIVRLLTATLNA